jgi:hypothetical protein
MEVIMKKTLLLAGVLLALTASTAMAAGVSVSWGNYCWGDAGSSSNMTWACNSNTNNNIRMTVSFKLDAAMPNFVGAGVYMEGMTESVEVPDWWKMGEVSTGDCRAGLISTASDYSVLAAPNCLNSFGDNTPSGGVGLYSWNGNLTHVNAAWATAAENSLDADVEYFVVQFRISASKTVGTCTGCLIPAIWGLYEVDVATPTTEVHLKDAFTGGNQCLTWQSSTLGCGLVPSRNTTWGQIKSLYR